MERAGKKSGHTQGVLCKTIQKKANISRDFKLENSSSTLFPPRQLPLPQGCCFPPFLLIFCSPKRHPHLISLLSPPPLPLPDRLFPMKQRIQKLMQEFGLSLDSAVFAMYFPDGKKKTLFSHGEPPSSPIKSERNQTKWGFSSFPPFHPLASKVVKSLIPLSSFLLPSPFLAPFHPYICPFTASPRWAIKLGSS